MRRAESPPSLEAPRPHPRAPRPCLADGPVESTQSVSVAVEFGSARYVELPLGRDALDASLVLDRTDAPDAAPLERAAVTALAELQNAVAYLTDGVDSVRVRTTHDRRRALADYVDELGPGPHAFGGATFTLAAENES